MAEIDQHWKRFERVLRPLHGNHAAGFDADPYYFFSRGYFHQLRDALGDKLHLCVVRLGESLACAGLFSEVCGIVRPTSGGAARRSLPLRPTKLMMHFIRCWAKEARESGLSSGRGAGREERFPFLLQVRLLQPAGRVPRLACRLTRADAYQALVAQWPRMAGVEAEFADDFFPAYRWPMRQTQAV